MFKTISVAVVATFATISFAFAEDVFPVTIEHGLGSTTIAAKPERVVTWGWSAQDVVIDLGVTPVGMPFFAYGGGEDGVLPWTDAAIKERGLAMPTVLPNQTEVPIEAIAALDPDVIIAPYSGITADEYALLSNIAPVVPFPETAWFASWQEVVEVTGKALGLSAEAAKLVADTEAFLKDEAAAYPELQGLTFANFVNRTDGQVSVRMAGDPRVKLYADFGMVPAPMLDGSTPSPNGFAYFVSYENFEKIPADFLVSFFNDAQSATDFFALPLIQKAPLIEKGAFTRFEGDEITMAVSGAITPLSLHWGFPQVIAGIGEAAKKAGTD